MRFTNKSVNSSVIRVLDVDHIVIPSIQMLLIIAPQNLHQILIDHLCLPIYMWMECCRYLQLSVHILPKCSPKGTKKYCILLCDESPWYPKVHPYFLKEHVCHSMSFDCIFTRHRDAHLVESINYLK